MSLPLDNLLTGKMVVQNSSRKPYKLHFAYNSISVIINTEDYVLHRMREFKKTVKIVEDK